MSSLLDRHYTTLLQALEYESPDTSIGSLSGTETSRRFVCLDNAQAFDAHVQDEDSVQLTIGITATGPPHAGTFGQLRLATRLQDRGFSVTVIIADPAAILAAGHPEEQVQNRTRQYQVLAREVGVDPATIRTQRDALEVLRSAALLSRYVPTDPEPDESTVFDDVLQTAYDNTDTPGTDHSTGTTLLLVADILHPLLTTDVAASALIVGADNHDLTRRFRAVLDASPGTGTVAGFYTPLVPGTTVPKVSKSIPRSGFSLSTDPDTVDHDVINLEPGAPCRGYGHCNVSTLLWFRPRNYRDGLR